MGLLLGHSRTRIIARATCCLGGGLFAVSAAVMVRAEGPVWHEFVPNVDPDEAVRALRQVRGEPDAVAHGGELLAPPDLSEATYQPPMRAEPGEAPGRRSRGFRPDRQTDLDQVLDYYASFNPSVAPFKRVTALDAVRLGADGETPVLAIASPERIRMQVESADSGPPDGRPRARFWGRVDLDFSAGRVLPLPSISPESRILSLRSQPAAELHVERDGAGNYFVVADHPVRNVLVRLSFLTDAPKAYFGMPIPAARVDEQRAHVPSLPESVRHRGLAFARELGLSRKSDLRSAVHRLVAHFRSFEESSEPPAGDDLYLALSRSRKGICRHRAYAFVVTAQALGIPARFVQNEAHSWVELRVSDRGFLRIDLGGAASGLRAHNLTDRSSYQPDEPDNLPRPEAYERSYARAPSAVFGGDAAGAGQAGQWLPVAPAAGGAVGRGGRRPATPAEAAAIRAAARDPRAPLRVRVDQRRPRVVRGQILQLSGGVLTADQGAPRMRVEISLADARREERMLLGVTLTDDNGRFVARLSVPPDLPVGDYQLVVLTPGDAEHRPAVAD